MRVFHPHPDADCVDFIFRRRLYPADARDEVWNAQDVAGPGGRSLTEARFHSILSDPEALVFYRKAGAAKIASANSRRSGSPRRAVSAFMHWRTDFGITCEDFGDGVGHMVGEALVWLGLQLLGKPERPPHISRAVDGLKNRSLANETETR